MRFFNSRNVYFVILSTVIGITALLIYNINSISIVKNESPEKSKIDISTFSGTARMFDVLDKPQFDDVNKFFRNNDNSIVNCDTFGTNTVECITGLPRIVEKKTLIYFPDNANTIEHRIRLKKKSDKTIFGATPNSLIFCEDEDLICCGRNLDKIKYIKVK